MRTDDPRTYGDGHVAGIPCWDQVVWCRTCGDLRAAELIDDLRSLKQMAAIVHGGKFRGAILRSGGGYSQPLLTAQPCLAAQIVWRRRRRSREKCFTCGSPRFVVARMVAARHSFGMEQAIPHPGCGGLFRGSRLADEVPDVAELVPDEGPGPGCRPGWCFW